MSVIPFADLRESETAFQFIGARHGSPVSFFVTTHPPGKGPGAHWHPYEETFIVLEGTTEFTVDGETTRVGAGHVVVVPARAVHSFRAVGEIPSRQVNIHPAPEMATTWID